MLLSMGLTLTETAHAQTSPDSWEDSLLSVRWDIRAFALFRVSAYPAAISSAGRDRLVQLLGREIDGTIAPPTADMIDDEEGYPEYLANLTDLVARFNDPRATPYFIRVGIAYSAGARFQVAAAGDPAVDGLVQTWASAPPIRPGVVTTFGFMIQYADSTGHPLTTAHRATVRQYLLLAAVDSAPWVRAAFVDAAQATGDPTYAPMLQYLALHDSAMIEGDRYVARDAGKTATALLARASSRSVSDLLQALAEQANAACAAGWVTPSEQCQSLTAKIVTAKDAIVHSQPNVAMNALQALQAELNAQRDKHVNEIAFALINGNVSYLIGRLTP
jgi:hypothetical protein